MSKNMYTASNTALAQQGAARDADPLMTFKTFLNARANQLAKWVTQGVKPEALIRFAMADIAVSEKLRRCTPESIYLGLLACAVTGLEPGALRSEAYLVPFGGKAQFIPGYRGLIKLARRSGEVRGITSNVVFRADNFRIDLGTANTVVHEPALVNRGDEVIGAYAIATMRDGHHELEWMDREDLDAVRRVAEARGKSPAWDGWATEMQRKSVVRRLCKRLPLGADFHIAAMIENSVHEKGDAKEVLDIVTDGEASRSEAQLARAPSVAIDPPADDFAFDPGAQS